MLQFNVSSLMVSSQQITMGFNIALWVIIAIAILGGIIGLIRGVWNASFRFIFVGTLVILSFVLCKDIANSIAASDISKSFSDAYISIGESQIQITTCKDTLNEIIKAYLATQEGAEDLLSDPSTIELIESVTMMIIRFSTMISLGLIVFIVGDLILSPILYHLLFKLIIPKKLRKKVKLRIVGFFLGTIKSALVMSLMLTPFTAIINTINQNTKESRNSAVIDNELYNDIMSWIDAYDDSYFAKVLFNWTTDENGNTFDMNLVENATSDSGFSFIGEIDALTDIAFTVIQSGAISYDGEKTVIDLSILLNNELVSTIIAQLTASDIIMSALPVAIVLALNMDVVQDYIDVNKIDLDDINWKDELSAIDTIYDAVYSSGAITEILNNPQDAVDSFFKEGRKSYIKEALLNIDNTRLLSQLLPVVIYKMVNTPDQEGNPSILSNYFPTDWVDYEDIAFGSEFALIYDTVYEVNKATDYLLIESFINPNDSKVEGQLEMFSGAGFIKPYRNIKNETETQTNNPLDLIIDNIDEILPHIVGRLDSEGNPITSEDGTSLESDGSCLLDSKFLGRALDKIIINGVNLIFANIEGVTINEDEIESVVDGLSSLYDYKKEFGALLTGASTIMGDEALSSMIDSGVIDIGNENVRQALKNALIILDRSQLIECILPKIVENNVSQMDDMLSPYGLSSADFDFGVDGFCKELSLLLDAIEPINSLSNALASENTADMIRNLKPQDIETILNVFHDSKILNPDKIIDDETVINSNFYMIIDYIFAVDGIGISNITDNIPYIDEIQWVTSIEDSTQDISYGENYYISQFFANLKTEDIISLITSSEVAIHDSEQFDTMNIQILFEAVDKSAVISSAFGTILDRTILPLLNLTSEDLSFTNVTDWSEEGANLKAVLDGIQSINKSFEQINWINENPTYVNDILSNFSKSQAFSENDFAKFVFGKLKEQLPDYLKDYPSGSIATFETAQGDFMNITDWEIEIDNITSLISSIQSLADDSSTQKGTDGLNLISSNSQSLSSNQIEQVLSAVNNCDSLRMVFVNAIDSIFNSGSINISGLTLQDANVGALLNMDRATRSLEISSFVSISSAIKNMNLETGFTIQNINEADISILLESMHNSQVFNTLKDSTKELTLYEQVISTIIKETSFETKILADGVTLSQHIKSIPNNYAGTLDIVDGWTGNGEISHITDIITAFKNTGIESFTFDAQAIEELLSSDEKIDSLGELLKSINQSELFFRAIPNVIDEAINNNLVSTEGLAINLTLINSNYNNGNPYEDIEITRFVKVIKDLTAFNNIVDNEGNKINNPQLKDFDLDALEELLNSLHDSKIFNSSSEGITFFENVIACIIEKGNIDDKMVTESRTLMDIINTVNNVYGYSDINDGWTGNDGEINKLISIIRNFQDLGLSNADITEISNITSAQIEILLTSINDSMVCYRSLPGYIDDLLGEQSIVGVDFNAANTHYRGDEKYDVEEIITIAGLYDDLSNIGDLFSKVNDLTQLDNDSIDKIENILVKLSNSYVFHKAGSDISTSYTVFEQIMIKIMNDSSIGTLIYDSDLYASDATITPSEKVKNKIVSYLESWESEIVRICDVIRTVKENFPYLSTPSDLDLSTITPSNVNSVLKALNESDILYDAVPIYTKNLFATIKINTLSENKENYLIGRDVYQNQEIDYLSNLLSGVKKEDGSYENFETFDVIAFVNNGGSIVPIMSFLDCSNIFHDINGLVFYSAIDTVGFGQYVRSDYNDGDDNVFTILFERLDGNQIILEGQALDQLLRSLQSLETIDLDGNEFDTTLIESVFATSYNETTKNMFVCEVLGGFLKQKFDASSIVQDGVTLEWYKEAGIDFIYPLFNEVEKNGIIGALNAKKIANVDVSSMSSISASAFDPYFASMETNGEKSKIAMAIYKKGFYNPFTTSLNPIDENKNIYFASNPDALELFTTNYSTLLDNPYSDEFSFVNENVKVKNVLTAIQSAI